MHKPGAAQRHHDGLQKWTQASDGCVPFCHFEGGAAVACKEEKSDHVRKNQTCRWKKMNMEPKGCQSEPMNGPRKEGTRTSEKRIIRHTLVKKQGFARAVSEHEFHQNSVKNDALIDTQIINERMRNQCSKK